MGDGRLEKMDVDYSSTVDELLPVIKSLAEAKKIDEAIEKCLALETQTRLASDAISTGRLLEAMVEILAEGSKWQKLNDHLVAITKKRGQLKQAVSKMTQKAVTYVDKTPDKQTKLNLIDALRTVTEGKIYVEVERARLTKELARIREEDGDIEGASSVLRDLQIETYGSMEKREKVQFILEQMRLCLACKDYIRVQIISKKVSSKFFQEEGTEDLKLKFYRLMIESDAHEKSYLSMSKHYWEIFNTKTVEEDEAKQLDALKNSVIYLLLAPFDNEQSDLMHRRKTVRLLESVPLYSQMLTAFLTQEIMHWDEFCAKFETVLRSELNVFSKNKNSNEDACWKDLHSRVIEHNIRIIASCYTQIRLSRLATLLALDVNTAEEYLSKLVVTKTIHAKIDRLESLVTFTHAQAPVDVLNDWTQNINSLMALINNTTHLINKERVIHAV